MSACAASSPVADACLWVKPIYSAPAPEGEEHADDPGNTRDTPETQAAVEDHNSDYLCRCKKDCQ